MSGGEDVGELGPAGGLVEVAVCAGGGAIGGDGEETAGLPDFLGVCVPVWHEVLFRV